MGNLIPDVAVILKLTVVFPPSSNPKRPAGFPIHIFQIACDTDAIHISAKIIKALI